MTSSPSPAGREWHWSDQYEETAERLDASGDRGAADEVRTLVDGLKQHERDHAALSRRVEELETALREIHAHAKYPTVASIQVLFMIEEIAVVVLAADPDGAAE